MNCLKKYHKKFAFMFFGVFLLFLNTITNHTLAQNNAQEAQERLNQLAGEIETSKAKREGLTSQAQEEEVFLASLSSELVLRAERTRIQEELLSSIEDNIKTLGSEITEITNGLNSKKQRLSELLAALERLSQHPPALVLFKPNESLDTIRSASLLSQILPSIRTEAEKLKNEITELETAKTALNEERDKEKTALMMLRNERDEMSVLVDQRQEIYEELLDETTNTEAYIADLVAEAETLEALLESLNNNASRGVGGTQTPYQAPANYPTNKPITEAKGHLAFPIHGVIKARYGSETLDGRLKGLKIDPDTSTQVIAPYDGRVVFAGVFRNYGQLLIISHGQGYHSLLSGLSEIYGAVGQWVLTGEPVGLINKANYDSDGNNINTIVVNNELYVEMRHDGVPINPTPWLAPIQR